MSLKKVTLKSQIKTNYPTLMLMTPACLRYAYNSNVKHRTGHAYTEAHFFADSLRDYYIDSVCIIVSM